MPGDSQTDLRIEMKIFWRVRVALDGMVIDRVAKPVGDRASGVPDCFQVMVRAGEIIAGRIGRIGILPGKNRIDIADIPAWIVRVVSPHIREGGGRELRRKVKDAVEAERAVVDPVDGFHGAEDLVRIDGNCGLVIRCFFHVGRSDGFDVIP